MYDYINKIGYNVYVVVPNIKSRRKMSRTRRYKYDQKLLQHKKGLLR